MSHDGSILALSAVLLYVMLVWWPGIKLMNTRAVICHLQTLACHITGAIKATGKTALEIFVDLPHLFVAFIKSEAMITCHRLTKGIHGKTYKPLQKTSIH